MLVGQKWRVPRSAVIDEITRQCGVNLLEILDSKEIDMAMGALELIRQNGLSDAETGC